MSTKKLYRSQKNKMISGICGGIGEFFDFDPTIVRLIWALLTLMSFGAGILLYIIGAIIIPYEY